MFSLFPIPKGNSGGATFLKSLKSVLKNNLKFSKNWEEADIVLLNSHHWLKNLFKLIYLRSKGKKFIIRIDGPLQIYRRNFFALFEDKIIYSIAKNLCSGIIYQSYWSAERNKIIDQKLNNIPDKIIYNGSNVFHKNIISKSKEYCLFVSNSNNPLKGIDDFKDLVYKSKFSKELNKLKFFVIGNFIDIKEENNFFNLGFLSKKDLAEWMSKSKYYIHSSKYEACSNALIEAIKFNMIPFVLSNSSNIELVKDERLQFSNVDELIVKFEKVIRDKTFKPKGLINPDIDLVSNKYIEFFDEILDNKSNELNFTYLKFLKILYSYTLYLFSKILFVFLEKLRYFFIYLRNMF